MNKVPKILIIRLSSIGDIVLTTAAIRCLKLQTNAEVHYLTKPQFLPVLKHNKYIDKIHILDKSLLIKAAELKNENFNTVIDLHNNLRTLLIKSVLQVKSFSFNKLNLQKLLMVNLKINVLPAVHIVDRYIETLATLNVVNDNEGLDYFVGASDFYEANLKLNLPPTFAVWAIGAQHLTKRLPNHKIIEILKQVSIPIVLLGDDFDKKNAKEILNKLPVGSSIINGCGVLTINQSAAVVVQSKFVLTNDTGLMHIAAAFKKPIISFWGNTIPQFGMSPYYGKYTIENTVHQVNNLSCRPCSKIGFKQCPKKHLKCLNQISDEAVVKSINLHN